MGGGRKIWLELGQQRQQQSNTMVLQLAHGNQVTGVGGCYLQPVALPLGMGGDGGSVPSCANAPPSGAINGDARIRQGKRPGDATDEPYHHATECTCEHLLLREKRSPMAMDGPRIDG